MKGVGGGMEREKGVCEAKLQGLNGNRQGRKREMETEIERKTKHERL